MTRAREGLRRTAATVPTAGEAERKPTAEEAQRAEFLEALEEAEAATHLLEPTPEEARNGWTAEALTAYVQEQQAAQGLRADPRSTMRQQGRRPKRQNDRYRPLRWRG